MELLVKRLICFWWHQYQWWYFSLGEQNWLEKKYNRPIDYAALLQPNLRNRSERSERTIVLYQCDWSLDQSYPPRRINADVIYV